MATQLASDNFTRANENPLSGSGNWTTITPFSAEQIVSDVCEGTSVTGYNGSIYTGVSFPTDQYSEVTIGSTFTSTGYIGAFIRMTILGNGYGLIIGGGLGTSNTCYIQKFVAGAATTLGATFNMTPQAGDVFRISAIGSTLTALQNGSTVTTRTDTTYTTGSAGILCQGGFSGSGSNANANVTLWAGGESLNVLSGNAGIAGATVILTGTQTATTTSDGSGNYNFQNLAPGFYFVCAQIVGSVISPWFIAKTIVSSDITGVNFTATADVTPQPIWYKYPPVLLPNSSQQNGGNPPNGVWEPTVIFEGNAQILSGNVFKMWFTGGSASGTCINYAESLDGISWTQYSSNPVISAHCAGRVFKNGATYYGYFQASNNDSGGPIDLYTSSDGVTWALAHASVLVSGAAGTWDFGGMFNLRVNIIGGTWYGLYTAQSGPNNSWNMGLATSPDGVTWTKYANNPVLVNFENPSTALINGTWYAWGDITNFLQGLSSTAYEYPTDVGRASSTDLINWTNPVLVLPRTENFEGPGALSPAGQIDSPALLQVGNKTYMWYDASYTAGSGANFVIGLAVANATLQQLIATEEGVLGSQQAQTAVQTVSAGTATYTFPSAVQKYDTIFVYDPGNTSTGVTDSLGNTYTQLSSLAAGVSKLWVCNNSIATGMCTVTVSCPNGTGISFGFAEYNTGFTTSPIDHVVALDQASGSDSLAIGPVATSGSNELVVFFGGVFATTTLGGAISIAPTNGFFARTGAPDNPGHNENVIADTLAAAAGNTSFTGTAVSNIYGAPMYLVSLKTLTSVLPYGISGNVGVAGATISWSGTSSGSTVADSFGNYNTGEVLFNGNYTITPTKTGYLFSPSSSPQTISNADISGVNFVATQQSSTTAGPSSGLQSVQLYGRLADGSIVAVSIDINGNIAVSGGTGGAINSVDVLKNGVATPAMVYGVTPAGKLVAVAVDANGNLCCANVGTGGGNSSTTVDIAKYATPTPVQAVGREPISGKLYAVPLNASNSLYDSVHPGATPTSSLTVPGVAPRPVQLCGRAPNGKIIAVALDTSGRLCVSGSGQSGSANAVDAFKNGVPLAIQLFGINSAGKLQPVPLDANGNLELS